MEQEGLNVAYLAYNTTQAPFDKAGGPQGAEHGDQQAGHRRRRVPGCRNAGKNPIPPTMWSYNEAVEDDKYDPEAAKKGLEAAGVKDLSR
jgi:dipeptide transport system substrate-binding protein